MSRSIVQAKSASMSRCIAILLLAVSTVAAADLGQAELMFKRAQYEAVIQMMGSAPANDAGAQLLLGKAHFALGEFKKSSEAFEKAAAASPSSEAYNWLGKAYGRR